MNPAPGSEVLSTTDSAYALTPFQCSIRDNIQYCPATDIITGTGGRTVFGLSPESRLQFTPSLIRPELKKSLREWTIRTFCLKNTAVKPASPRDWKEHIAKPDRIEKSSNLVLDSDKKEFEAIGWENPDEIDFGAGRQLKIPAAADGPKNKELLIVNKDSQQELQLMASARKGLDSSDWLKPGEAILLRNTGKQWQVIGTFGDWTTTLAANPLKRESGMVLSYDGVSINTDNDGEYYLSQQVMKDLLSQNCGEEGEDWHLCEGEDDLLLALKKISAQSQEVIAADPSSRSLAQLVYEDPASSHMLAVRVSVQGDKVHCYLHETLSWASPNVEKIREAFLSQLEAAFLDKKVMIFAPAEAIQIDSYSCGVYALDAIEFFISEGGRLDTLIADHESGQQEVKLTVNKLPAQLLKYTQNEELLSVEQKQETVAPGVTLEVWLDSFRKPLGTPKGVRNVSTAGLVRRYELFQEWAESKDVEMEEAEEEMETITPVVPHSKKVTEDGPVSPSVRKRICVKRIKPSRKAAISSGKTATPPRSRKKGPDKKGSDKKGSDKKVQEKRGKQPDTQLSLLPKTLLSMLESNEYAHLLHWTAKKDGHFKIVDPADLTKHWRKLRKNPKIQQKDFIKAIKYWEPKGIIKGQKEELCYCFNLKAPAVLEGLKQLKKSEKSPVPGRARTFKSASPAPKVASQPPRDRVLLLESLLRTSLPVQRALELLESGQDLPDLHPVSEEVPGSPRRKKVAVHSPS